MAQPVLEDFDHLYGEDLKLSPTGGIATVSGFERSRQRIIRRMMTSIGDYIWEPDYGAGLPKQIGQLLNLSKIRGIIRSQMRLEPSVVNKPEPIIKVTQISGGVAVTVQYVSLPDKQPVSLSFRVEP